MSVKLSICIPTYNFAKFIGQTLDSILPQVCDGVEIVILDGASTDNTQEVVEKYQKEHPCIRYIRKDKKGGIDRDIAATVDLAIGEYCWLFSSDDVMRQGAIQKLLGEINESHDVYIVGFTNCGLDINVIIKKYPILDSEQSVVFNLSDPQERIKYFKKALTTPAFFSFMSSLVIKRASWMKGAFDERYIGECWSHVARLFSLIPQQLQVKYLPETFLYKRSFNDSFMANGILYRLEIAVIHFQKIADDLFGSKSIETSLIRRAIQKELSFRSFLKAKAMIKDRNELKRLNAIVRILHSNCDLFSFFCLFVYFAAPRFVYYILFKLYWFVIKRKRSAPKRTEQNICS